MEYSAENLPKIAVVVEEVAREAAKLLEAMFQKPKNAAEVTDKSVASIDMVTDTDKACERLIFGRLKADFPTFEFIGEETSSEEGSYTLTDAPTFIVDPVDGTTNAIHRHPDVSVSIGLSFEKQPVLGVVFDPIRKECYKAWKNGGAFLNDKPIHVDTEPSQLSQAIVSTNIGYRRNDLAIDHITGSIRNLMKENLRGLRMNGSACNQITSVACGRVNCFFEYGPHPWDVCAGAIVVLEAGGIARDMRGGALDLCSRHYLLACNEEIASAVTKCLKEPIF